MAEVESPAHPRDALRDEQSRILLAAADEAIEPRGEMSVDNYIHTRRFSHQKYIDPCQFDGLTHCASLFPVLPSIANKV